MTHDTHDTHGTHGTHGTPGTPGTSRRAFLGAGLGAVTLSPLLRPFGRALDAAPIGTKRLIVVFLEGGNDGLNTFVPVQQQAYYDRRPSLHIDAGDALSMDAGPHATKTYRLHPACTELARLWQQGSLAVVQKVGYPDPNLSHFLSLDVWSRGARSVGGLGGPDSGWIARFKDLYAPGPIGVAGLGVRNRLDFSGGRSQAVLVSSFERFVADLDPKFRDQSRLRHEVVRHVLRGFGGRHAELRSRDAADLGFDMIERLQDALRAYRSPVVYPNTNFARRCREAAMLVKAGFKTRIVYVKDGGFDTHANQGTLQGRHAGLLARIDGGVGALARDLQDMGAWNDTVIAVVSEFGRRNYENGSSGTDHGTSNTLLVTGGAVRGGLHGPELTENDLLGESPPYGIDFRSLYKELLREHLGVDPAPVFPEKQEKDGRIGLL